MPLRFVIIAAGRTGSNLLVSLVRSHRQTFVGGEIFNLDHVERKGIPWSVDGVRANPKLLALMRADPATYLERLFELAAQKEPRAIGFKLLYSQASAIDAAREYLAGDRSIRVIHLKRHSLLRQYLSLRRAKQSDRWVRDSEDSTPPALRIEPAACVEYFEQIQQDQARFDGLFAGHELLELFYEDMAADPCAIGDRAVGFLGLEPGVELWLRHRKIGTDSLRDAIVNYDELASALGDWRHFFE